MLPFLAEPEALVPQDSTTGILDIENRHDLLVHEGEPKRIGPSRTESVPFVETRRVRKGLTPDDLGDLLDLPFVAVLATYRRDGHGSPLAGLARVARQRLQRPDRAS